MGSYIDKDINGIPLESIDDLGDLPDIEGITFNGKPLSANNLDNLLEAEISE